VIRRSALATACVIGALVFTTTTPAQAADQNAIKRAIVITVLNNLGVQPTAQLIDQIVGEIPVDFLDSRLVRRVGTALDNSEDPALMIGQTVDSDGDSDDEAEDETEDETEDNGSGSSGSTGSNSGSSGSSGSSGNNSGSSNSGSDNDSEEEDPDDDSEGEDPDDEDESGDDEDN
jgi:uncharacterized membrane protein YgcG